MDCPQGFRGPEDGNWLPGPSAKTAATWMKPRKPFTPLAQTWNPLDLVSILSGGEAQGAVVITKEANPRRRLSWRTQPRSHRKAARSISVLGVGECPHHLRGCLVSTAKPLSTAMLMAKDAQPRQSAGQAKEPRTSSRGTYPTHRLSEIEHNPEKSRSFGGVLPGIAGDVTAVDPHVTIHVFHPPSGMEVATRACSSCINPRSSTTQTRFNLPER